MATIDFAPIINEYFWPNFWSVLMPVFLLIAIFGVIRIVVALIYAEK